jgi:hypothetical protein
LYNGKDYFYTTDTAERAAAVKAGFKLEGVAAYVLRTK